MSSLNLKLKFINQSHTVGMSPNATFEELFEEGASAFQKDKLCLRAKNGKYNQTYSPKFLNLDILSNFNKILYEASLFIGLPTNLEKKLFTVDHDEIWILYVKIITEPPETIKSRHFQVF